VCGCNGEWPLRAFLSESAGQLGVSNPEKIALPANGMVGNLVALGFLVALSEE